jgi:PilZ domain
MSGPIKDQVPPIQPSTEGSTPSAPAEEKTENRKSARRRVLKDGKVLFDGSKSVVDVTIDNMSEGGAHIRMLSSHGLPQELYLCETTRGIIHRTEVVWRTGKEMGLRLLGLLEDTAVREAFLKRFRAVR